MVSKATGSSPKQMYHSYMIFAHYEIKNIEFSHPDLKHPIPLYPEELSALGRLDELEQTVPRVHSKGPRGMRSFPIHIDDVFVWSMKELELIVDKEDNRYELTPRAKSGEYTVYFTPKTNGKHAGKLERIATHK